MGSFFSALRGWFAPRQTNRGLNVTSTQLTTPVDDEETRRNQGGAFKVVIVGDAFTGKSSIIYRVIHNGFEQQHPTMGASFSRKTFQVNNRQIDLGIWDTAGQERFKSLVSLYYRDSKGVILVYDITNHQSFERMRSWYDEIGKHLGDELAAGKLAIAIVGNKCDLEHLREIPRTTAQQWAQQHGAAYLETSAKTGTNVVELFQTIAEQLATIHKLK